MVKTYFVREVIGGWGSNPVKCQYILVSCFNMVIYSSYYHLVRLVLSPVQDVMLVHVLDRGDHLVQDLQDVPLFQLPEIKQYSATPFGNQFYLL